MSSTATVAATTITSYLRRIEFWTKPLPFGIGRFLLELDNTSGDLSNLFAQDDLLSIKRGALDVFKGYVDISNPQVTDPIDNRFLLSGRDMGQDLMNKTIEALLNKEADDIIEDLLTLTSSEITFTSPTTAPIVYHDSKGWTTLMEQLSSILQGIDYEGAVDPAKAFSMAAIGTLTSGITLKSILDDPTNNILRLLDYVESDGVEQRNVTLVTGAELNDHFTELNAADFGVLDAANTVIDSNGSPTTPREGLAVIKVVRNAGASIGCKLTFPKYFLYYLDFSKVASDSLSCQFYSAWTGGAQNVTYRIYLEDTDGNKIYKDTLFIGCLNNTWNTVTLPIGTNENNLTNWTASAGTLTAFNWECIEISWAGSYSAHAPDYFLLDAWKAPQTTYAVADHSGLNNYGGGVGVCPICARTFTATRRKDLPLSKSNLVCQAELEAYAESIADKRMNPLKRLHLIADGDAGIISTAWKWLPAYNVTVNVPSAGINSAVYRMIDLHHTISEPTGNDPAHTVELQLVPYNQPVDSQQWSYTKDGKIALIRRLHDRLRWLENRKGYVP